MTIRHRSSAGRKQHCAKLYRQRSARNLSNLCRIRVLPLTWMPPSTSREPSSRMWNRAPISRPTFRIWGGRHRGRAAAEQGGKIGRVQRLPWLRSSTVG